MSIYKSALKYAQIMLGHDTEHLKRRSCATELAATSAATSEPASFWLAAAAIARLDGRLQMGHRCALRL